MYTLDIIKVMEIIRMYVEVAITVLSIVGMGLYYSEDVERTFNKLYEKIFLSFGQVESLAPVYEETKANNLNNGIQRLIHITLGINSIKMVYVFWSTTLVIPLSIMNLTIFFILNYIIHTQQ